MAAHPSSAHEHAMTDTTDDAQARIAFARAWTSGSMYYERTGLRIDEIAEERARLRIDRTPDHLNPDGIVHGGVLPSLVEARRLRRGGDPRRRGP
jgi:acyl-coenzyme A thioesterase PaaI-like protein